MPATIITRYGLLFALCAGSFVLAMCMPTISHARVGANVVVTYQHLGTPVAWYGLANRDDLSPGEEANTWYAPEQGYLIAASSSDRSGSSTWEQSSGGTAQPYFYDRNSARPVEQDCVEGSYDSLPQHQMNFAAKVPPPPRNAQGATVRQIQVFAVGPAPYASVALSIAGVVQPVHPELSAYERHMLALINAARVQNGAPALKADTRLNKAADSHAFFQDWVTDNDSQKLTHCGRERTDMTQRIGEVWPQARINGSMNETVSSVTQELTSKAAAEAAFNGYMSSSSHAGIMMASGYRCVGIGFGSLHTTLNFVKDPGCDTQDTGELIGLDPEDPDNPDAQVRIATKLHYSTSLITRARCRGSLAVAGYCYRVTVRTRLARTSGAALAGRKVFMYRRTSAGRVYLLGSAMTGTRGYAIVSRAIKPPARGTFTWLNRNFKTSRFNFRGTDALSPSAALASTRVRS